MIEKSSEDLIVEAVVDEAVAAVGPENVPTILSEVINGDAGLDAQQQLQAIDVLAQNPDIDIDAAEARLIKRGLVIQIANQRFRQSKRPKHRPTY